MNADLTPLAISCEQGTQLGPARVVTVAGKRVLLSLEDRHVWAVLALAGPYEPVADDVLLALGAADQWYAIGVLSGKGKTTFTAPADLELRAPSGKIELVAGQGVTIRAPSVSILAQGLKVAAQSVIERFEQARRWVTGTSEVHAGRSRTVVDESYRIQAGRIVERADGDVKIDGRKIRLG